MADSIGGPGFPKTSIQEGHLHFDRVNNVLYIYNGGDPSDDANWSIVGGGGVDESIGLQRYTWAMTEPIVSTITGATQDIFIPSAGTIVKWGFTFSGDVAQTVFAILTYDRLNLNIDVDNHGPLTGAFAFERDLSFTVPQPNGSESIMMTIRLSDSSNLDNSFNLVGFVDFLPN